MEIIEDYETIGKGEDKYIVSVLFKLDGYCHRDDGPAKIDYGYIYGDVVCFNHLYEFLKDAKPEMVQINGRSAMRYFEKQIWANRGVIERKDAPAIIQYEYYGPLRADDTHDIKRDFKKTMIWYEKGFKHNDKGPAFIASTCEGIENAIWIHHGKIFDHENNVINRMIDDFAML